jgi:PII-like signaling protein
MHRLDGERTLMRVFIGESDRYQSKPLYKVLLELFRQEGFAGATVLRGVAGFGPTSVLHTDGLLRLSQDLPLVIEVVDSEEKIEQVIPRLDEMLQGGMVTLEKARVIFYRNNGKQ